MDTMTAAYLPAPVAVRARDIADLTVAAGYPCISVLAPTRPAPRMTRLDLDRLHGLVADVERELHGRGVISRERLLQTLTDVVRRSAAQPTDRGLAIYVSLAMTRTFRLPQTVEPRAVVESTFATRALVAALHRMPPHVVLVLHPGCAHLYAAADGTLRPVAQLDPFRGRGSVRIPRSGDPSVAEAREELTTSYLRGVDRMLGDYRTRNPRPLVLVGPAALLDRFCTLSRHLDRLAGRIAPGENDTALDLALASAEAIEDYLRSRRDDALRQLRQALRDRPDDVASGIADCWRSLRSRAPGMLLVEEDFISPGTPPWDSARDTASGPGSARASEPDVRPGPPEVHDLVDDLMEQVILRGGQLALVRDGDLRAQGRIALVSRR